MKVVLRAILKFWLAAFLMFSIFSRNFCGQVVGDVSNRDVEELNFKAIKAIHKHLDDDQDGDVNLQESTEFMKDELQLDDRKRHSSFHGNDSLISVEDLWKSWKQSEVHNWTNEQVIGWLNNVVGLPQYDSTFSKLKIDGRMLPRFTNESSSLYGELGINNVKDRKKIYLRSTDIVLFGPPRRGYLKDIILTVIVILMTFACLYAFYERKYAKKQIEQMIKDVEFMQQAEDNLKSTQEKLLKAEMEHISTVRSKREIEEKLKEEIKCAKKEAERLHLERNHHEEERIKMSLVEQELNEVRRALQKAEAEMESMAPRSPKSLQQWLHITYRKESKHFIAKKTKALKQMEEAREACDKIRKKRSSIFGPLRLVHGQTIDEVDQKILQARSALAEVTNDLQERQHRWRQIEELCGFPIVSDGRLGHSPEIEENTRRSSIAQALAVCANLGGIGSFPDPERRLMSPKEFVPESPRNNIHLPQKSMIRESDLKKIFKRNSSLISEGYSTSGRSSPACALSSQEAREDFTAARSSSNAEQSVKMRSFDSNDTGLADSKLDGQCSPSPTDTPCHSSHVHKSEPKDSVPSEKSIATTEKASFHVSHSTPAFPTVNHSLVRSSSLTSGNDKITPVSRDTLKMEANSKKDDVNYNSEAESNKDLLSFEIFSSDENLFIGTKVAAKIGSNTDVAYRSGSVEELASQKKEVRKKMLRSLKLKKPEPFDQFSLKSNDGTEIVKRRSIFSKLKKK